MQSKVTWKDGMAFDVELDGFNMTIDATEEHGGRGLGARPKGLLLSSLGGCTAMDVISILRKMRAMPESFEVEVRGELRDEDPRSFTNIVVSYRFEGRELKASKIKRAIQLSEERYCGVSATLRPAVQLGHEIWINGEMLEDEG